MDARKSGRPKVTDEEKNKMRNVYLTDEKFNKIKEYGGGKFAKGIHKIIDEFLDGTKISEKEKTIIDMIAFDLRGMADKYSEIAGGDK